MLKLNKSLICGFALAAMLTHNSSALTIKEKNAKLIAGTVAALAGASGYLGAKNLPNSNGVSTSVGGVSGTKVIGGISAAVFGILTYWIANKFTPTAKYNSASKILEREISNPLLKINSTDANEIIWIVRRNYKADNDIYKVISSLENAYNLCYDAINNTENSELKTKTKKLLKEIDITLAAAKEIKCRVDYAEAYYDIEEIRSYRIMSDRISSEYDIQGVARELNPSSGWPLLQLEESMTLLVNRIQGIVHKLNSVIQNTKSNEIEMKALNLKDNATATLETARRKKQLIYSDKAEYDRQYHRLQQFKEQQRLEEERRREQLRHEEQMRIQREKLKQEHQLQQQQMLFQQQQLHQQNQILEQLAKPTTTHNTTVYVPTQVVTPAPAPVYNPPANQNSAPSAPPMSPEDYVYNYPTPSAPPMDESRVEAQNIQPSAPSSDEDAMECSICLEQNTNYKTNCGHYFHKTCLDSWKNSGQANANKCPMCRSNL